jgi:hypothetical protein
MAYEVVKHLYNFLQHKRMNSILKIVTFFVGLMVLISCTASKDANYKKVNTKVNSEYKRSITSHSGTLTKTEYDELIRYLEVELKTTIPKDSSIFINYNQNAPNCMSARLSKEYNLIRAKNTVSISLKMSSDYNAISFFVYTDEAYFKEVYEQIPEFVLDSGFFYKNIFTEHQNCSGYIIIKPSGEFYKQYGEDHYSIAKAFFEKQ